MEKSEITEPNHTPVCISRENFDRLFAALKKRGYKVVGPAVRDGAIVYDTLEKATDLPEGWTDEQDAGTYKIRRRDDKALFGYVVGPHSWKKFLFPPRRRMWRGRKKEDGSFETWEEKPVDPPRYAFLGVRACELHAIQIQDKVFMGGTYQDPVYAGAREDNFIVAVNCGQAARTCFCTSMNTGPKVGAGHDLALTEIIDGNAHYFVAEAGTDKGAELMAEIPSSPAKKDHIKAADVCTEKAKAEMGRTVDMTNIKELLYRNYDNARWEELEKRCLACGNCTMACPTCFCSKVEDSTDLSGDHAERWRSWDSCFTMDFSYIHGGSVRSSIKSRYRQWLVHKLATWIDQFGSSGCVGCGRCITWCPVGIDLTEEVKAIRESEKEKDNG
jgi:formate hydrogenlyase subunit 6/NADH:ubiquinone oxidoreductase subunit I